MEDRYLLISDLDGTLLGDEVGLAEFAKCFRQRRDRLRLVYNSGRFVSSILESVESTDLPIPDAIIGGVGTQIRCGYANTTIGDWPARCRGWQPLRICSILSSYSELQLQPVEQLSDYKISYYAEDVTPELVEEIRYRLAAASCRVEMVYSSNRDLDLLPAGVNKGTAAAYLASHWSFSKDRVLVSGDTANDLAMFENGFRGIVVGNAHAELKRLHSSSTYQAKQTYAGGVMEGLSYWWRIKNGGL